MWKILLGGLGCTITTGGLKRPKHNRGKTKTALCSHRSCSQRKITCKITTRDSEKSEHNRLALGRDKNQSSGKKIMSGQPRKNHANGLLFSYNAKD